MNEFEQRQRRKRNHAIFRARTRLRLKLTLEDIHELELQVLSQPSDMLWKRARDLSVRAPVVYRGRKFTAVYDLQFQCITTIFE